MAITQTITKQQQKKLQQKFGAYGEIKPFVSLPKEKRVSRDTLRNLLRTREADIESIKRVGEYLGYELELEQHNLA